MTSKATAKIVQYLSEAHATELALVRTLQAHVAITPRGSYRGLLERHLEETRGQARALEDRLSELGEGRNIIEATFEAAFTMTQGIVGQALALSKGPIDLLRGSSGEEKLLKNAKDECATEALEIATYDALEQLAVRVGDERTAELARRHRAQEERMLDGLRTAIPGLVDGMVRAELEGEKVYDVTETGAAENVRELASETRRRGRAAAREAGDAAGDVASGATDAVRAVGEGIGGAAGELGDAAGEAAGGASGAARTAGRGARETAVEATRTARDVAGDVAGTAREAASDTAATARAAGGEVARTADRVGDEVGRGARQVGRKVGEGAEEIGEDVSTGAAEAAEDASAGGRAAGRTARSTGRATRRQASQGTARARSEASAATEKVREGGRRGAAQARRGGRAARTDARDAADAARGRGAAAGADGGEPWSGYDRQSANEVVRRLARSPRPQVERVREYEREHKDRVSVLRAAERQLG